MFAWIGHKRPVIANYIIKYYVLFNYYELLESLITIFEVDFGKLYYKMVIIL
jgi:hypothetical protein